MRGSGNHLLVGDEAALPALIWRLDSLPRSAQAIVVVEVESPDDRLALSGPDALSVFWVYSDRRWATRTLNDILKGLFLPQESLQAWVSCGREQCQLICAQLVEDHGVHPERVFVSAF